MTDLTQLTATELSSLYQSGAVSPVDVANQLLNKIQQVNPKINAFCFTDPETTLAQAQASEHRWQQKQPLSVLDGVPIAVKDSILTQGWPTRHASRVVNADQPWVEDAPAVARLREAGTVFVGKTTMSEFGSYAHNSDSMLYGKVCNPWNVDHSPGGSSGGSAAAVSAGLVPVALASDLGGSVAVPSAFCGIFGMKPSIGRVPQWPVDVFELSAVGPMARTATDIALLMNIITKPDVRDGTSLPYSHANYTQKNNWTLEGKKFACVKSMITKSVENTVEYLLHQGAQVDFVDLDIDSAIEIFYELPLPKMLQQWLDIPEEQRQLTSRDIQRRAILAHRPEDTHAQLINRHRLITQMRKVMQSYEMLLGPVVAVDSNRQTALVENISPLSMFFCITKQPTVAVPVGVDCNGMPMSVMIAGAMHNDHGILQLAQALESEFPMPDCPLLP
jgi:aspartyl-tRNA(Asn)/glutamyl-tRNA(Gln) amidotransferase subunit A